MPNSADLLNDIDWLIQHGRKSDTESNFKGFHVNEIF